MGNSNITPFVKWAGGKRQLLSQIKERYLEISKKRLEKGKEDVKEH